MGKMSTVAVESVDKTDMQNFAEALSTLRETVEKNVKSEGEIKQITDNCETKLKELDAANTAIVVAAEEKSKKYEEMEAKLVEFETKLTRLPINSPNYKKGEKELKAFIKFCRYGKAWENPQQAVENKSGQYIPHEASVFTPEEVKLLRTDVNDLGGFLAPPEFVAEILKLITEISPIRQISRIRTTSAGELVIPLRESLVNAEFIGEAATKAQSNSTYGENRIKVNKLVAVVQATTEMLNDSAFNMEEEIRQDVVETFAQVEGEAFVNGDSVNQPEGFMFNTQIPFINSGISNNFDGDNLITLVGELKSGQNPMFALNRRTIAAVRKLKDSTDAYLFNLNVGLERGIPATIAGEPFISVIDMPDTGVADNFPIIYGDFRRGYNIVDGFSMTLIRDPFTLADSCKVRFIWKKQTGAQVVLFDAFVKLKLAV